MDTYITKQGDTLGAIAKKYGVGINNITGYRSGNPNVIGIGEKLTIQKPTKPINNNPATDYSSIVKNATNVSPETPQSTAYTLLGNKITAANTALSTADNGLKNIRTTSYNNAYKNSGLDKIKINITSLDNKILQKRQSRDEAIFQASTDPGFSMAELTGMQSKIARRANSEINNLIGERNSLAGNYNTGLQEVGRIAGNASNDALQNYTSARNNLTGLTDQAKTYQSMLMDALKQKQLTNYENKQIEIGLIKANAAKTKAVKYGSAKAKGWKLATDPVSGTGLYWYNASGQTRALSQADKKNLGFDVASTTVPSLYNTPASSPPWYSRLYNFFSGNK